MTIDEQLAFLRKSAVEIIREEDLRAKLEKSARTGRPLRVKLGADPTAPDIHLGHTVVIRKLRAFQELGHTVIFLIGDFTGLIGDPSGKSATRPQLTREEINANAETYKKQIFKLLDPDRTEIRFNSEWMDRLGSDGFIRLASHVTVRQILSATISRSASLKRSPSPCTNFSTRSRRLTIPWRSRRTLNSAARIKSSTCSWAETSNANTTKSRRSPSSRRSS